VIDIFKRPTASKAEAKQASIENAAGGTVVPSFVRFPM
jgi:hypothetical protein